LLGTQTRFDIAQALSISQLGKRHETGHDRDTRSS
jgi:hypothetical protein